jgi:N-acetylglucosamine-6-phosphate deacetylase
MKASLKSIAAAIEKSPVARSRILKIHLEGPYISALDGPRGAHPVDYVRSPDWDEFTEFQAAAGGRIGLVTLAPELPKALDFIVNARRAGVIIGIGHHAANREQIRAAVSAGASLATHLGNGAHQQLPRHPNYIWEQMAEDDLIATAIVDGRHLPPSFVKVLFRAKGISRLILISDLVAPAGLPPGKYQSMGLEVEVVGDGSILLTGTPYQAGSGLRLCEGVRNLMRFAGCSLAEAVATASTNPARLLGVDHERGHLRVGDPATVILLTADDLLKLAATIIDGHVCYQSQS